MMNHEVQGRLNSQSLGSTGSLFLEGLGRVTNKGINWDFSGIMLLPAAPAEVQNHPGGVLSLDPTQWSNEPQICSLPPQFTEEKH